MIKSLTSLRFFFALLVFLSHLQFFPKTDNFFSTLYEHIFREGYLGVSFFFILSGFVLSLSYGDRFAKNKITFTDYLIARIARIYPLHLLTFIISLPLALGGLLSLPKIKALSFTFLNVFLLQSWIPKEAIYFSFNMPSWSISDEFFFYLIFPFLISFIRPVKIWHIIPLLVMPLLLLLIPERFQHAFFYVNPIFRVFDFYIGILLYEVYKNGIIQPKTEKKATMLEGISILLFLIFFLFHGYMPQVMRYSIYYWLPMSFIILTFAYNAGKISRLASNNWLVLGGEISFGLYMIHQLVIRYAVSLNERIGLTNNYYIVALIVFVVSIVASYLLYRFFEMPINKMIKNRFQVNKYQSKNHSIGSQI